MSSSSTLYIFGEFEFNPPESRLTRNGLPIPISKKALQTLSVLIQRSGHLVEKSELINAVWGDAFVEEGNLVVVISMLRKILGDDRSHPRYIETVSKSGYRFVAEVRTARIATAAVLAEREIDTIAGPLPLPSPSRMEAKLPKYVAPSAILFLSALVAFGFVTKAHNKTARSSTSQLASTRPAEITHSSPSSGDQNDARQQYIVGRHYADRRTPDGLRRSIEYFQEATIKDPEYAEAYSGIADSYSLLANYALEPAKDDYPVAITAGLRAVELNASLAEPHTSLGLVFFKYEWDWARAEDEFRRSLQLNPSYPLAYIGYASCLTAQGRFEEALQQTALARQVDPSLPVTYLETGMIYYFAREYAESINTLRQAIDLDPYFGLAYVGLGRDYAAVGDYPEALAELRKADQLTLEGSYLEGLKGNTEARSGRADLARTRLDNLLKRSEREYVPAYDIALIYIGLGERDLALDWLDKAYQERSAHLAYVMVEPLYDSLRSEHRFRDLTANMKLQEDLARGGEKPSASIRE